MAQLGGAKRKLKNLLVITLSMVHGGYTNSPHLVSQRNECNSELPLNQGAHFFPSHIKISISNNTCMVCQ